MLTITVLMLTVGALLAAFGTLGFYTVASTAPDPHDLAFTRRMATLGRRMVFTGVIGLATVHIALAGPVLACIALVGFTAAASYLTRAPLRRTTTSQ